MLEYINMLLIFLIICVLIIDSIYVYRSRKDIEVLKKTISKDTSLVDLSEFNGLDPTFKGNYKRFVVGELMPPVIEKVNQTIKEEKVNEYITENQDAISRQIKEITDNI